MSLYATKWAYAQDVKPAGRKFVLVAIADFADAEGRAFPGASTIAEMTGQDERSVRRHIDSLEQDGFIKSASRRRKDGSRTTDEIWLQAPEEALRPSHAGPPVRKAKQPDKMPGSQPDNSTGLTGQSDRANRTICPPLPDNLTGHDPSVVHHLDPSVVVVSPQSADATSQTTTPLQETNTENGSGASAEPRKASVTHQDDDQAPQQLEASQTTSNKNVPGAARAALRRGFSETFLTQLLGEFEDRQAWLDLPPPRIDELLRDARLAQGSNYKTALITALDDAVRATRARASPNATMPVKPKVSDRVLEALKGG